MRLAADAPIDLLNAPIDVPCSYHCQVLPTDCPAETRARSRGPQRAIGNCQDRHWKLYKAVGHWLPGVLCSKAGTTTRGGPLFPGLMRLASCRSGASEVLNGCQVPKHAHLPYNSPTIAITPQCAQNLLFGIPGEMPLWEAEPPMRFESLEDFQSYMAVRPFPEATTSSQTQRLRVVNDSHQHTA